MNARTAVDAGRAHHWWLPDQLCCEQYGFTLDSLNGLRALGHLLEEVPYQGVAEVVDPVSGLPEGGVDDRVPDGAPPDTDRDVDSGRLRGAAQPVNRECQRPPSSDREPV